MPLQHNNKYLTINYTPYDNANRLLGMNIQAPNAQTQIESLVYTYDANGNRISMSRPSVTLPLPNPVTNTSYNAANQMLSFNDKNIIYDNNGNMSSVTNTCGITNYTWDVRNRLTEINGFKADCTALTTSFKYDTLGRRIEKTINGTTTKYLYDGVDIIQEKQNGIVSANYIRTLNIDEPLTRIKADGTVRHYVKDALGSVIALTDDSGVVKTTYSYDPFGQVIISGESSDNPFQYTGRENDNTGLYYYRARYYSPELQRFISEDLLECERNNGNNLYSYVKNNPLKYADPRGTGECEDKLEDCTRHALLNDFECTKNAVKVAVICSMSCPIVCAGIPPCIAACEAICAEALEYSILLCQAVIAAEIVNCYRDFAKCKNKKKCN